MNFNLEGKRLSLHADGPIAADKIRVLCNTEQGLTHQRQSPYVQVFEKQLGAVKILFCIK
jgi:hypothetical protein